MIKVILLYHIVLGNYAYANITGNQTVSAPTLLDPRIMLTLKRQSDGTPVVNQATVVEADIPTTNGLIQGIDSVLIPSILPLSGLLPSLPTLPALPVLPMLPVLPFIPLH
jgi:uncharacterized surface protein with fasciclin (FAS1) repeats